MSNLNYIKQLKQDQITILEKKKKFVNTSKIFINTKSLKNLKN